MWRASLIGLTIAIMVASAGCTTMVENEQPIVQQPEPDPVIPEVQAPLVDRADPLLLLVDKQHPLGADYVPTDLVKPDVLFSAVIEVRKQVKKPVAEAIERMFADAAAAGLKLYFQSGYRTYQMQKDIYARNVSKYGTAKADTFSARPGYSEHQSGLAVDLTCEAVGKQLEQAFANTPEGKWVAEHAVTYGFVMSYPKDKKELTGYMYEPWHFRYVGEEHARFMKEHNLILAQYLEQYAKSE